MIARLLLGRDRRRQRLHLNSQVFPCSAIHGDFSLRSREKQNPNCDWRSDETPTDPFALCEESSSTFVLVGVEYQRPYQQVIHGCLIRTALPLRD
jgi:hypothetical protein